ncbi:MAG TPA: glycoside hydrolase family 2 TIM barrel-domain containing protein [Polyangiaceae bacterium]|nr:glycoside hydrolase family 2 TIM barrel-domain containing protein [Polyangiaceae bacterium]
MTRSADAARGGLCALLSVPVAMACAGGAPAAAGGVPPPAPPPCPGAGAQAPSDAPFPTPAPPIQNVYGRKVRSLDGAWKVIVDPYESGYYDYRHQSQTEDGYFVNRRPSSKSDRVEYDFDKSGTLLVPGDWNSQRPELFLYEGSIWYKTDLDARPLEDRRLFVHFGAANYDAKIYVNGRRLGEHVGGFTPFDFELTDDLRAKDNFLIVKVDNQRHREAVPTVITDWWNYGGITRDVVLVDLPRTFIRDYSLQLARDRAHHLTGWVQLDGPRAEQAITVSIQEAGLVLKARTDTHGFARIESKADVERWSFDHPKLYDVEIAGETDRVRDRIGFRTLEVRGADILLNGKSVFLRGISMHEQAPLREGRAFSTEDDRTLLGWARELGANFVRLAHYPHNEHMIRLADEMGLMIWAEIPVYWTIEWDNPATLENAENQLSEMIERDKNRASVVIWSVGNETPPGPARLRFMRELVHVVRRLDPSRLVSAALERGNGDPNVQTIDDPLGAELDVLGCNEYLGWYDGLPERADSVTWRSGYDKPLIMTELGADALAGLHGDPLTRWTEEYQASVCAHQVAMLERIPFLRGMTPWILADFRSPRRPLPGIQDYWNRKGLVSNRGERKQAFFVLQKFYERLAQAWSR